VNSLLLTPSSPPPLRFCTLQFLRELGQKITRCCGCGCLRLMAAQAAICGRCTKAAATPTTEVA